MNIHRRNLATRPARRCVTGWRVPALVIAASILVSAGFGCSSTPYKVGYSVPDKYERLGNAEGSACGGLYIIYGPLEFIPIRLMSRYERAYEAALASVPGAVWLDNVTIEESWYWAFGTVWCTTIKGEAVR